MKLGSRQRKTLEAIFKEPTPANIAWSSAESLLKALGAEISEGRGSRVRIHMRGVRAVFHRPHPQKEMHRGAVRSLRRFLIEAGVQSER